MAVSIEARCRAFVEAELLSSLRRPNAHLVRMSIALGALEQTLTDKAHPDVWPENLEATVDEHEAAFETFLTKADAKIRDLDASDLRGKVKAVADLIWSHLTAGSFSKDAQHVQHLHAFTRILAAAKASGKRQLDCAGVVTTTLAACQRLAAQHEAHSGLAACRLQISEDHCWIQLDPEGAREGSVEMALAALVASVNPSIRGGQASGADSEPLQALQHDLLRAIRRERPGALYPAAICCLADLAEIRRQDELQAAVLAGQKEQLGQLLERGGSDDAQGLFEEALAASQRPQLGGGRCWYPFSYLIGFLTRRARFVLKDALPLLGEEEARRRGFPLLHEALRMCGGDQAAAVLRGYRFSRVDEQLHKDVEGVLEMACEVAKYLSSQGSADAVVLAPLLELWDGVCCCWAGKPKPAPWLAALLRVAKLFTPEARQQAAASAQVSSQPMASARELWGPLKPAQLRPLFEAADVGTDAARAPKRPRR